MKAILKQMPEEPNVAFPPMRIGDTYEFEFTYWQGGDTTYDIDGCQFNVNTFESFLKCWFIVQEPLEKETK